MLRSGLSALSDRVDSKFLTAFWLPAFVAVFGGFVILALIVGGEQMDAWVSSLDSVEQTIGTAIILLHITMLAFVLRALTEPIADIFAGSAVPRIVATWSMRGQRRARTAAERVIGANPKGPDASALTRPAEQRLRQLFPQDDADMQPTLFGNVVASAAEHPRLAYSMDGGLWWPRLAPLLPSYFQDMLGGTQAPMMGMLNLSVVFFVLALLGLGVLGVAGGLWVVALVFLTGGMLLSRLCYRAAVSQAVEFGSMVQVAFDLYRHEILKQMEVETPSDLAEERALWRRLTRELLDIPDPPAQASAAAAAVEAPPAARPTAAAS
jgi:hypothetical protein